MQNHLYRLGFWSADWFEVEEFSNDPIRTADIECKLDLTPLQLPKEIIRIKKDISLKQQKIKEEKGESDFHNGPTYALSDISLRNRKLVLTLRPSDYYTFLSTAMSLNENIIDENGQTLTIRDKYLKNVNYKNPIAEFASSFAIQFSLITKDEYIVASERGTEGIVGYPGHLAPAVNENLDPDLDRDQEGNISILKTAKRGASDELNLKITQQNLRFLCIGVDVNWYMYTLIGFAKLDNLTKKDIISKISVKTSESWEVNQLYFIPNDPFLAAKEMRELSKTKKWSPYGIVCITRTLVSQHGSKICAQAFEEYPPAL